MAEIKIMQQHIINYAKTRDVYVAYRKAGYSKKFLSEHESEIILHKAAKQFFDEQGLKKLPTVKSLQAEYAQLLSEKKAMYADFQMARDEMRSLQTAKANVDWILGAEKVKSEKGEHHTYLWMYMPKTLPQEVDASWGSVEHISITYDFLFGSFLRTE